jgi:hypothetical protein
VRYWLSLVVLVYGLVVMTQVKGQQATLVYPTFTPSVTPSATPTLAALGNTITTYFSAPDEGLLTGKPFTITLTIDLLPNTQLTEAPTFPAIWGDFVVRSVGELTSQTMGDQTTYTQELTVLLWRPGYYSTPETFIGFTFGTVEETQRVPIRPAFIHVPSVLDSQDYNLRPFKPVVYLPYLSPLLVIGVLVAAMGVVWGGWNWYQRRPVKAVEVVPPSSFEVVRDALRDLKESQENPTEVAQQTVEYLRRYLASRFETAALDLTTNELISVLRTDSPLPDKLLNELHRLLGEVDMIKFANVQPDNEFARRLVEVTERWVIAAEKVS